MKSLFCVLIVLFATNAWAIDCAPEFKEKGVFENVQYLRYAGAELTEERFAAFKAVFKDLEDPDVSCRDTMAVQTYYSLTTGKIYVTVTSTKDTCDGGNVIGVLLDLNSKPVGIFFDGDFYCEF